jgi:hypothetical protein
MTVANAINGRLSFALDAIMESTETCFFNPRHILAFINDASANVSCDRINKTTLTHVRSVFSSGALINSAICAGDVAS